MRLPDCNINPWYYGCGDSPNYMLYDTFGPEMCSQSKRCVHKLWIQCTSRTYYMKWFLNAIVLANLLLSNYNVIY